jgi:hypothetical protein
MNNLNKFLSKIKETKISFRIEDNLKIVVPCPVSVGLNASDVIGWLAKNKVRSSVRDRRNGADRRYEVSSKKAIKMIRAAMPKAG